MEEEKSFPNWEELYQKQRVEEMPWYHPELDPDIVRCLATYGIDSGHVLDLGTGPGTQAMTLAGKGFQVTASDISESALNLAREKAWDRGFVIDFVLDDILQTVLTGPFDLVIDRGCFHVFAPALRPLYVQNMRQILGPGGLLFLKTFSHRETRPDGPYRFSVDQIRGYFGAEFDILETWDSIYQGTLEVFPLALCSVLRRKQL